MCLTDGELEMSNQLTYGTPVVLCRGFSTASGKDMSEVAGDSMKDGATGVVCGSNPKTSQVRIKLDEKTGDYKAGARIWMSAKSWSPIAN